MELSTIIVSIENSVATITFNRPQVLNAMNRQFWLDFDHALDNLKQADEVKVVVITGAGKAFSSGADLKESKARTSSEYRSYIEQLQSISLKLIDFPKPTIAAINGYAIGSGYELALACDLRVITNEAKIGSPEAKISTAVTGGASLLVQQLIGPAKAKELLFIGDFISGKEAFSLGLANYLVDHDELLPKAYELADKIKVNSALSLSLIKSGLNAAASGASLEEVMQLETESCLKAVSTEERSKALDLFEKRG